MAFPSVAIFVVLTSLLTSSAEPTRWSRQISSYTADLGDWVPLPGPVERLVEREPERLPSKRQAVAEPRILSEPYPPFPSPGFGQDTFPSRAFLQTPANRQLYLQSVPSIPSAPQNFLNDAGFGQQANQGFGQSIRFGLSQPNFPLSQGFVAPQLNFNPSKQIRPPGPHRPPSQNPIKFESFPKALPLPQQGKPFNTDPKANLKPAAPKFVDGYQLENTSSSYSFPQKQKKPVSLQKLKYDFEKPKTQEPVPVNKQKSEREEVQLLYVPVESLNRGQYNFRAPLSGGGGGQINSEFYNQNLPKPQYQQFASDFQRPVTKPFDNFNFGPEFYAGLNNLKEPDQIPKFSTISSPFPTLPPTTPRPKKLKPHQPPLAVFLAQESKKADKIKVGDVLSSLKNANTISVLDSVDPSNAPKVFIGPSSLNPPERYVKFELPYLSNIENSDRKLKQLPFFVAPLSYNTPDGFAKIPFPSPHVGSVIVNSQAKDASFSSTPVADVIPNSYTASSPSYKQEKAPQKPTFSYYSTAAPKTNPPPTNEFQTNYYSFEPQTVTSIRPQEPEVVTASPKPGSYYVNNNPQYNQQPPYEQAPVRGFKQPETQTPHRQQYTTSGQRYTGRPQFAYEAQGNVNSQEPNRGYNTVKQAKSSTTPRTTIATKQSTTLQTTQTPAPYPNQLLETHNPYSINQAFYQSTPVDYQQIYEEYKEVVSSPSTSSQDPSSSPTPSSTVVPEPTTERTRYQSSSTPSYMQSYSPEIHYESEVQSGRFPVYNSNDYTTKIQEAPEVSSPINDYITSVQNQEYNREGETPASIQYETPTQQSVQTSSNSEAEYPSTRGPAVYNQYSNSGVDYKEEEPTTTTISTTTTKNDRTRTSVRARGRPRYTTTPRTDSSEVTKATSTRRPLRERRPLPNRSRYEPNKITTERATKKPAESAEATTKSSRQRVRGRVQFKASENDDVYSRKSTDKKENDLSYQRDVLHQNYPVTIQERMSTVDIEAMTEPTFKLSSTRNIEPVTETLSYDTELAYTNEQAYSQQVANADSQQPEVTYSRNTETQTESTYVPRLTPTRNEENIYHSRSSAAPAESVAPSAESISSYESDYSKPVTEPIVPVTEQAVYKHYTKTEEFVKPQSLEQEDFTTRPELEITKEETSGYPVSSSETVEEIPQTTPAYRVRRPGVRQYQQTTSTTEASTSVSTSRSTKYDRKRPSPAVTYRPAFDRRRTTMRIEEIEADLKTKQVHSRNENSDNRHPVYRPEPTTAPTATTAALDATSKRGQFRRRRPSYTTTSTETAVTKKSGAYDTKNRFKSRQRTTDKPTTEKSDAQTDAPTTTTRPYSRYSRPRLSERYNKKQAETNDDNEDQESHYSINRPRYVNPDEKEEDQWAAKYAADSFKPYNPNDIQNEEKYATTERRSSGDDIITARNDFEEILVSVTPASNRANKVVPEIPPTLEALVEQSKTATENGDTMSTFETMLDEVMKSLEEQDENEYNSNVLKHKGGEIGEIPPERVISAAGDMMSKTTTAVESDVTTLEPSRDTSSQQQEEKERKGRRRGFWKKVNVRPVTTESIEVAESQYYSSSINRLGDSEKPARTQDKLEHKSKPTTYKPSLSMLENSREEIPAEPIEDIRKISAATSEKVLETTTEILKVTKVEDKNETVTEKLGFSPGELDLGTGSPDPTMIDMFYTPTTTEVGDIVDRSDGFSLMDYFFGVTASDNEANAKNEKEEDKQETQEVIPTDSPLEIMKTEEAKPKLVTTESSFIPDEFTSTNSDDTTESIAPDFGEKTSEISKAAEVVSDKLDSAESTTVSSFMDPNNVVSTSMSTEVSHETEICFRGKCIKTNKDIL